MAKITPMELLSSLHGKVCSHSDIYFAERNGTRYTGKICNPYKGEPTDKQVAVRQRFSDTIAAIAALTDDQLDAYADAYTKQRKYKTLRGFIFAQEYNKITN